MSSKYNTPGVSLSELSLSPRKIVRSTKIINVLGERPSLPIPPPTALTLDGYDMVVRYSPKNGKITDLFNDRYFNDGFITEMSIDGIPVDPTPTYTFTDDWQHVIRYKFAEPEFVKGFTFSGCTTVQAFKLSDSITTIGMYAFDNCDDLTDVEIPNVSVIGPWAFLHCSKLESIVFGENLRSISDEAFWMCGRLKEITCYAPVAPNLGDDLRVFASVAENGTLYFPKGSDYSVWMQDEWGYLGHHNWTAAEIDIAIEEEITDTTE